VFFLAFNLHCHKGYRGKIMRISRPMVAASVAICSLAYNSFAEDYKDCNQILAKSQNGRFIRIENDGSIQPSDLKRVIHFNQIFKSDHKTLDHYELFITDSEDGSQKKEFFVENVWLDSKGRVSWIEHSVHSSGVKIGKTQLTPAKWEGVDLNLAYDANGKCRLGEVNSFYYDVNSGKKTLKTMFNSQACTDLDQFFKDNPDLEACKGFSLTSKAYKVSPASNVNLDEPKSVAAYRSSLGFKDLDVSSFLTPDTSVEDALSMVRTAQQTVKKCIDPSNEALANKILDRDTGNRDFQDGGGFSYYDHIFPVAKALALKIRCDRDPIAPLAIKELQTSPDALAESQISGEGESSRRKAPPAN